MNFVIEHFNATKKYESYNSFDCGHVIINKFVKDSLKKQVQKKWSVAYALLEEKEDCPDRFVGFFTLVNYSIPMEALSTLNLGSLPKNIPCVRLIMLGINEKDAGKGLGRMLMNHALDVAKKISNDCGCYGIYLDADEGAVKKNFYQKLGFQFLEGDKSPNPSPMFLKIQDI